MRAEELILISVVPIAYFLAKTREAKAETARIVPSVTVKKPKVEVKPVKPTPVKPTPRVTVKKIEEKIKKIPKGIIREAEVAEEEKPIVIEKAGIVATEIPTEFFICVRTKRGIWCGDIREFQEHRKRIPIYFC